MFGAFRFTPSLSFQLSSPLSGGLLWKIPWRLSRHQKYRHRLRMRRVDSIITTLDGALQRNGLGSTKKLDGWKENMPTEAEMVPKDKYTVFDRKVKSYRKGIHKVPKWTRVSQRVNPPGF